MALSDPWKQYLEAGLELGEVTRARAEKLVKDLIKAGEVQRHERQQRVEDLLERSRKTTEAVAETVRSEVMRQLETLGLVQPAKKADSAANKTASTTPGAPKKTAGATKQAAKKTAKKTTTATKKATGQS